MASVMSTKFIDQALSSETPFPLSYTDPQQRWVIRTHLISFLNDHPSFTPSFGTFFHDDGDAADLLCATGHLRPSSVPLTIWLHQNHPFAPPIVLISASAADTSIHPDHPFVALSGRASCPYLDTWSHPRSSLSALAANLSRLFSRYPPFVGSSVGGGARGVLHPSLMSRQEALDHLVVSLHYDLGVFGAGAEEEACALVGLRDSARERARGLEAAAAGLQEERRLLKRAASGLAERSDAVVNFLRVNNREMIEAEIGGDGDDDGVENAFEISGDAYSAKVVELLAAEKAVEDVMYALDDAVQEGVVSIDVYLKQVRLLAREQFIHKAKLVKLRGSGVLRWSYYS